ncbi:MAG: hypothetical protein MO853_12495 [Candidatus Protistobacter heckmanni]|nr:hypothetical protein [Candidatus Protistobacter heckmanni]
MLKPDGKLYAVTPYYPRSEIFTDPTHVNPVPLHTHTYFAEPHLDASAYGFKARFAGLRIKYEYEPHRLAGRWISSSAAIRTSSGNWPRESERASLRQPERIRMKPRIYDCFPFFNENILLALRLELMYEHVDHFVIVESTHTFTGQPKKMYFSWEGLERYRDKIIHVIVDDMHIHLDDPVKNETYQRNAILRNLKDARPDDLVLISDLDEIPNPKAIGRYDPRHV